MSTPMPIVGILADDLTSAADGAAPFVAHGRSSTIGRHRAPLRLADVLAVDMATRSRTERAALNCARSLTPHVDHARLLYKTVDSTLRGHVRAEIAAVLSASRRSHLVFAPAFPAAGRVTRGGIQFVDGLPVAESRYAHDPVHPARISRLADLVPEGVAQVTLIDAETQSELDARVASIPAPEKVLWVGSPGLAIALARRFGTEAEPAPLCRVDGDLLIVVGSANTVSRAQADAAAAAADLTVISAPAEHGDPVRTVADLATKAASALRTKRFGGVIATGGDTMEAILNALRIFDMELLGEFEPGFPVAVAHLADGPLVLAMKAGGFGQPDTLIRAARRLRQNQETSV